MTEQLKIDFDKIIKTSGFSDSDIRLKKEYLDKFIKNGFPNRKLENWKFSDISQIIEKNIGKLSFYNDDLSSNKVDTSIFIDEFDALCKSRSLDGQLYHQQMLASILSEIDGFSNKGRRNQVLTIGATNRPWDLDAAVLSRFERRILIGLPDKQAREDIFRIHLEDRGLLVKSSSTLYFFIAELFILFRFKS